MRLAHELGKQLHEVMGWRGPMTHRQFEAWSAWLAAEQNNPSRADHYAMAIRAELRALLGKQQVNFPGEFRIVWEDKGKPGMTREEATRIAKAAWGRRLKRGKKPPPKQ